MNTKTHPTIEFLVKYWIERGHTKEMAEKFALEDLDKILMFHDQNKCPCMACVKHRIDTTK